MRYAIIAATLLAGCNTGQQEPSPGNGSENVGGSSEDAAWDLQSSGEGSALVLADGGVRLFCPTERNVLVVNVQSFRPVGSEERMTFGQGRMAETLVADSSGDAARGGVTAEGPVPENLAELLSGPVAVNYGSQNSGPHPTPPTALVNAFAGSCGGEVTERPDSGGTSERPPGEPRSPDQGSEGRGACLTGRDGGAIPANRIRAVGTEPFWGASVEGRCVTYSHPEDQSGTRVWTEFSGSAENGTWSGFLNGRPFVMKTRPQPGCSDGMSDRRYPIEVALTVDGEQRQGCAAPR